MLFSYNKKHFESIPYPLHPLAILVYINHIEQKHSKNYLLSTERPK